MTKSDQQYFDKKFSEVSKKYDNLSEKYEKLLTTISNVAGDIARIEENTTVLSYHNSQHFDKDEEQDKRLDRVDAHLGFPALAV